MTFDHNKCLSYPCTIITLKVHDYFSDVSETWLFPFKYKAQSPKHTYHCPRVCQKSSQPLKATQRTSYQISDLKGKYISRFK